MSRQPRKVFGFTGGAKYGPLALKKEDEKKDGPGGANNNSASDTVANTVSVVSKWDCSENCTIV